MLTLGFESTTFLPKNAHMLIVCQASSSSTSASEVQVRLLSEAEAAATREAPLVIWHTMKTMASKATTTTNSCHFSKDIRKPIDYLTFSNFGIHDNAAGLLEFYSPFWLKSA